MVIAVLENKKKKISTGGGQIIITLIDSSLCDTKRVGLITRIGWNKRIIYKTLKKKKKPTQILKKLLRYNVRYRIDT